MLRFVSTLLKKKEDMEEAIRKASEENAEPSISLSSKEELKEEMPLEIYFKECQLHPVSRGLLSNLLLNQEHPVSGAQARSALVCVICVAFNHALCLVFPLQVSINCTVQMDALCSPTELQEYHPTKQLAGVAQRLISLSNSSLQVFALFSLNSHGASRSTLALHPPRKSHPRSLLSPYLIYTTPHFTYAWRSSKL